MNLNVFDFQSEFTMHEIACLALGLDPGRRIARADETAYRVMLTAANAAAEAGAAACKISHMLGHTRAELGLGAIPLYPAWAYSLVAIDALPSGDVDPCLESEESWREIMHEVGPIEGWTFDREMIADWLTGRGFSPAYDFSRPGGPFRRSDEGMNPSERPATNGDEGRQVLYRRLILDALKAWHLDPKALPPYRRGHPSTKAKVRDLLVKQGPVPDKSFEKAWQALSNNGDVVQPVADDPTP